MNNHPDPPDMCHKSDDINPVDMINFGDTTFE